MNKSHVSYSSGTLIHELVHAHDLAYGQYSGDYSIREKRAIFFQNIWRHLQARKFRSHYHRRFKTVEFQEALNSKTVEEFVSYFFSYDDIP